MNAVELLERYNKKKNAKPPSAAQEIAPILYDLFAALNQIASKELPTPLVEVAQPDVKVSVEAPVVKNDIKVPELNPTINVDNYDYTKIFAELKSSVDKLTAALENRPTSFKVMRDNRGLIEQVDGINEA